MKNKLNVLVTGCGGDIGQSIGKILVIDDRFQNIIGSDLHEDHAGKFIFTRIYTLPLCSDENYLQKLSEIVERESIDLLLPVSEAELRFFNKLDMGNRIFGKPLVVANKKAMDIGFDKMKTASLLKDNGLPFPVTSLPGESGIHSFPLIMKSRSGSGSKSVFVIHDEKQLGFFSEQFPGYIIQELVGNAAEEYTCGLFRSSTGETRQITYKRTLMGGFSGFGIYENNPQIEELLFRLAELVDLEGSINVQLRLSPKGPCIFEINPRFSSTVLFRHLMGFEDVIWSIQNATGTPVSPYQRKTQLTKFYKGFSEYVE